MNYDTTENILWPFEPEEENLHDEYDEADLMFAEFKLNKTNQR